VNGRLDMAALTPRPRTRFRRTPHPVFRRTGRRNPVRTIPANLVVGLRSAHEIQAGKRLDDGRIVRVMSSGLRARRPVDAQPPVCVTGSSDPPRGAAT
jgi:hypothetical protein